MQKIGVMLLTIMIFLFCLSLSILLTLINVPAYILSIYLFDITVLPLSQLVSTYLELLKFLLLPHQTFTLRYFDISSNAVQHFYDVKAWLTINNIILVMSGLVSYFSKKYIRRRDIQLVNYTLKTIFAVLMIVIVMIIINFNQVFIVFHEILFKGSYWQFDPIKDAIILALPEGYFMLCFIQVIIFCSMMMLIIYKKIRSTQ